MNFKPTGTLIAVVFLSVFTATLHAQTGGRGAYSFADAPVSARIAALGGLAIPVDDGDISLGLFNPALISEKSHNQLSLSYVDFFSDINYGSVQYGRSFERLGNFSAGLQYYNYGTFDYADEGGQRDGQFSAADYVFVLGWGRQLDSNFSIGANAKFLGSAYESYSSFGLAVDVAGTYKTKSGWLFALTARNIGRELKSYQASDAYTMPFSMQFGVSKRLDHVPFRIIMMYDRIEKWDLTFESTLNSNGTDPITGEIKEQKGAEKFADQLMRHIVVGGEFYIGKNLVLRGSYNYGRRKEMIIPDKLGTVGFSWGMGVRISRFNINYSRSAYHVIGSPNYLTISTNLSGFKR